VVDVEGTVVDDDVVVEAVVVTVEEVDVGGTVVVEEVVGGSTVVDVEEVATVDVTDVAAS
jgi:hypothetical protein